LTVKEGRREEGGTRKSENWKDSLTSIVWERTCLPLGGWRGRPVVLVINERDWGNSIGRR